ncbi:MAG: long-chain fatty acid--CoA ligase, partial [Armatimonadetes bacterium]|nr:long-chain fatty acid--CoA ligase [Armatimonadota bacterium]
REVSWKYHSARMAGRRPDVLTLLLFPLLDAKVLRPLRERITGGELRYFISGGAPLPVGTARFITSLGLNMLEGYGLTETSPVICVNRPNQRRLGTVGPVIPGVEVRIAPDGEILSRGPHIMQGYFKLPEATAEAIDEEGWFHTGDIGELDPDGMLRITDRKKDLLVLANGKNVAPQPIEATLKASQYISAVVLFGDRQPNVVALVVPEWEHLKRWAKENNIAAAEPEVLIQDAAVRRFYKGEIDRLTQHLADFEKIRRFALVARDFSAELGELTPTLKIKRRVVAENFAAELQAMYGGRDT